MGDTTEAVVPDAPAAVAAGPWSEETPDIADLFAAPTLTPEQRAAVPLPRGPEQMQAFQDAMRNHKVLAAIAQGYLRAGSSRGMEWLTMAHAAAHESLYAALGALDNGDVTAAVWAFNTSGYARLRSLHGGGGGTFTWVADDGRSGQFVLDDLRRSLVLLPRAHPLH